MDEREVLAWLARRRSRRNVEGMARYGIVAPRVFGVSVGTLLGYAKKIGKDHELAAALWATGWYEARLLAAMVDDPAQVTRRQMNTWVAAFDNWAICDTVCWHLFEHAPCAWEKARQWSTSPHEFVKRAAFAIMAGRAGHDRTAPDAQFLTVLPLIEKGARDERNLVKKGVSWALRRIGGRSLALHEAALKLARRLSASDQSAPRWVGKDVLRDLTRSRVRVALVRRSGRGGRGKRSGNGRRG